jgi:hypothetical protein
VGGTSNIPNQFTSFSPLGAKFAQALTRASKKKIRSFITIISPNKAFKGLLWFCCQTKEFK